MKDTNFCGKCRQLGLQKYLDSTFPYCAKYKSMLDRVFGVNSPAKRLNQCIEDELCDLMDWEDYNEEELADYFDWLDENKKITQ